MLFCSGELVARFKDNDDEGTSSFYQIVKILEYKPEGMRDKYLVEDYYGNKFEEYSANLTRNTMHIDNWDAIEYHWEHKSLEI